jgi:hypothetical protein
MTGLPAGLPRRICQHAAGGFTMQYNCQADISRLEPAEASEIYDAGGAIKSFVDLVCRHRISRDVEDKFHSGLWQINGIWNGSDSTVIPDHGILQLR